MSAGRSFVAFCLCAAALTAPGAALAKRGEDPAALPATRHGRPRVELDRLDVPDDLRSGPAIKKQLRHILAHETKRANWGTGRGATIAYRFELRELTVEQLEGVIRVRCSAIGRLPGGKRAKSHLVYGGRPLERAKIVHRVLEIVARGVVGRLAEMERVRRGDLRQIHVRAPVVVE